MAKYVILVVLISSIIYKVSKGKIFKWFYHDKLGWHIPNDKQSFNGCSCCSTCKLCGKEIMQDSQGNWF